VDLFDPGESNIAPGSAAALVALGRVPGASGPVGSPGASPDASPAPTPEPSVAPGASAAPGAGGTDQPPVARDELWVLVVLVVLAFLVAEWLVYHRDAVTRLWRGLRGTPEPGRAGGTGRSR
jgi:hypothetical protein